MKYRAEIDGLRALVVVPVILFHAGFELFSGGFVGVDVFFVISGYLITTILIEDIEKNRFSIVNFYERRVRRILPALFFVMLVCIPFAWMWMLPNQMKGFSQSLVAVSLFASNILFWRETGYFDATAEEKPLLHTWSLAIEEQYYVLFPIFLFLAWRFGKNRVFWMIVVFAAISLAMSEWGWRNKATANFYLAPTRAWELFAGSIAAFIVQRRGVQSNNALSLLGLAAILFAIFAYDESTPFPSVYALVPVVGVVLLVLFANKETLAAKLLSTKLFVGIGLISYSAYLWHQPLFAFARIRSTETPSTFLMYALCGLSMLLAYFSWRFVEKSFRDRTVVSKKRLIWLSTVTFCVITSIGVVGHKNNGYQELMLTYKFPTEKAKIYRLVFESTSYDMYANMFASECHIWIRDTQSLNNEKFNDCANKHGKALVVLGDSHAMNLYNIVAKNGAFSFVLGVSQGDCPPNNKDFCHYKNFLEFLKFNTNKIDRVIYHQSGSWLVEDRNGNVDSQLAFEGYFSSFSYDDIRATLEYLEKLSKSYSVNVTWVGPFLEFRRSPLEVIGTDDLMFVNPNSVRLFGDLEAAMIGILSSSSEIEYLKFSDVFFEPIKPFIGNCFVFRDTDHYSQCGEKIIAERSNLSWLKER